MSTNEITLERLRGLMSQVGPCGLNLFLGAGISRDAPTNGPIWSEMQVGFLEAVFDRMEGEGWLAASDFPADRETMRQLSLRPELFWRTMLNFTDENVIWKALGAAGVGPPNENHARVATLLRSGQCRWAITTNFDEHVEALLGDDVPVAILTDDGGFSDLDSSTYVKLHGSIGVGRALSYTLEHYDKLTQRNELLLERMVPGRPLVIAGYSGYDTDVLPALHRLADRIPWIVVIRHPGSPDEQPILQLAAQGSSRSYVLESTCPQALGVLTEGLKYQGSGLRPAPSTHDRASYYVEAVRGIGMHRCPWTLSEAFLLSGAWGLVSRYAWLTHDAMKDPRYRPSISEGEYQHIHRRLALLLKYAGNPDGASLMLNEAEASVNETDKSTDFLNQRRAEALVYDAPSQVGETRTSPWIRLFPGFKPSEILATQLEMAQKLGIGNTSERSIFEANWDIGRTRVRERNFSGAIQAFDSVTEFALGDGVTHPERGRFFLDFGNAISEYTMELRDYQFMEQAYLTLRISEKSTQHSGDWFTNAQANRLLARLYIVGDRFTEAWDSIRLAREAVSRTKHTALSERIEQLARSLTDLQTRLGKDDS